MSLNDGDYNEKTVVSVSWASPHLISNGSFMVITAGQGTAHEGHAFQE